VRGDRQRGIARLEGSEPAEVRALGRDNGRREQAPRGGGPVPRERAFDLSLRPETSASETIASPLLSPGP